MSAITTHVIDITAGSPVEGIPVTIEFRSEKSLPFVILGRGKTDKDGRNSDLLPKTHVLESGLYCIRFDTSKVCPFFPEVLIQFQVNDVRRHYHIPLLLSSYGYSTYRGQ
jgi:5-hydroxyisourate hydrolase